ncbi:hypothetical protein H8356DRAFT_926938 [Neocallimastix lanati (nom. inval.)]|uniref:MATH domain-containing protein n=1 Tax=Neocallimastix californiae TaxID=1754190 RepID=A0A1Y1XHZ0_9FUNG|nr:hypothetical protein H8356DRAFT_1278920 [Neocallimastix sp. JGI-2020a]KAG4104368.1 hypothetical protein H8356DRAFT_926938 [Neocallimastix sp. JGI-2020a]ORX84984.1 hypothetical protein LY90DRAFT_521490 [Neocallimastix californiae]|eukprot:ORX84984.1 hypothetical protein LY90DRAFT_521490 [Neocallimastix californiae]
MILQQYYKEFNVSLHDILKYNNDYIIKDEDFNDNQNNWNLSIQKKSINDKYFISFKISNLKNIGKAIKTNLVFYIRNDTDYSYFKAKGTNNFIYFGETNNNDNYLSIKFIDNFTMDKFLTIEELSKLFSNCNSIIAGVYICIYNNNGIII